LATEQFLIAGELRADSFLPWIERHIRRLGLHGAASWRADGQVEIILSGPPDLIDAMELGVSLGPIDVWVETVGRRPLANTETA
jgi:acylphosphatase